VLAFVLIEFKSLLLLRPNMEKMLKAANHFFAIKINSNVLPSILSAIVDVEKFQPVT